jgi:hypothetical protein
MGLGVLNDPKYPNVPGTVRVNEAVDPGVFIKCDDSDSLPY